MKVVSTSQQVLTALAGRLGQMLVAEICEATGLDEEQVQTAIKNLSKRGYVTRLGRRGAGRVKATAQGIAFIKDGGVISSGRRGPRLELDDRSSLRSRLWRALRLIQKGTIAELLELAARGEEGNAHLNAKDYLNALVKTGHVVRMARRGQAEPPAGTTPTRYSLWMDNGPLAPVWNKRQKRVYDPNIRTTFDVV